MSFNSIPSFLLFRMAAKSLGNHKSKGKKVYASPLRNELELYLLTYIFIQLEKEEGIIVK